MITLEELDKWFDRLNKIIFDIKVSIDNIKKLAHPENDYEKEVVNNGFFYHFYRQSRFVIIVQLSKLFDNNKNQKINFHLLFNRLYSDNYDEELLKLLENNEEDNRLFNGRSTIIEEIEKIRSEISNQDDKIEKVVDLRDKFYAHSDPNAALPKITNEELNELVALSIKIYNTLRGKLSDTTFLFEHNQDWRVDYPVKVLAADRKQQHDQRKAIINKNASASHGR
jgi:hypothetical protein